MKKIFLMVSLLSIFVLSVQVNATEGQSISEGTVKFKSGELQIDYVSDFEFGQQEAKGKNQTYYAALDQTKANHVELTDLTGSGNGWMLGVKQTEQFKHISSQKELIGSELTVSNGQLTKIGGEITNAPYQWLSDAKDKHVTFAIGDTIPLVQLKGGQETGNISETGKWLLEFGKSTEEARESVFLTVPGKTEIEKGDYVTTLEWNMSNDPVGGQ